jgi:hypothetical protein
VVGERKGRHKLKRTATAVAVKGNTLWKIGNPLRDRRAKLFFQFSAPLTS